MNVLINADKRRAYWALIRADKPIGIWLLLWPTLWALWIAGNGSPSMTLVIIFSLGVVLMRSAGCIANDLADQRFDGHVSRTRNRPLVSGAINRREALICLSFLVFWAFCLVCFTNLFTMQLAMVALALALLYPFAKRFIRAPQVILGLAFSWSVIMAFAAQTDRVPLAAWVLYVAVNLWVIAYDTFYALVDKDDDLGIGIHSTAIWFGKYARLWTALLQLSCLFLLAICGVLFDLGVTYYSGLIITALLFGYQQWLIRRYQPEQCFKAFCHNHWVGMTIFIALFFDYHF